MKVPVKLGPLFLGLNKAITLLLRSQIQSEKGEEGNGKRDGAAVYSITIRLRRTKVF
jgi:hypothetical protein